MKSNCIQIKYKENNDKTEVQTIQFSGVDAESTSDLNSVLGKINRTTYKPQLDKLDKLLKESNNLTILEDSDITRIADYKVGNVSVFTLQTILQNRGSLLSSELDKMVNILNITGVNIKSGNVLITNTTTPQIYIGEHRTLLELPSEGLTNENVLNGMCMLYADNQLNNLMSSLFKNVEADCNTFINENKSGAASAFATELSNIPDDLNRIKRYFYKFIHTDSTIAIQGFDTTSISNRLKKYIETSISTHAPLTNVDVDYFSQKHLDYLETRGDNLTDEITLSDNIKVPLQDILSFVKELHTVPIENQDMSDKANVQFINDLQTLLVSKLKVDNDKNYIDSSAHTKIMRLSHIAQLNTSQVQLKYMRDKFSDNGSSYGKIYDYLLEKYINTQSTNWIENSLTEKIRNQYKKLNNSNFTIQDSLPVFRYDNNTIFKPSNKISFYEFNTAPSKTYTGKIKEDDYVKVKGQIEPLDPNESKIRITDTWITDKLKSFKGMEDSGIAKLVDEDFKTLRNTKVRTLVFSHNVVDNHKYLVVVETALANGFNIELPANGWVMNKIALTRSEYINKFYKEIERIQNRKYRDFNLMVAKLKYSTSKLIINDENVNAEGKVELVTNDIDLINQELRTLTVLSLKSKYNLKIEDKIKITLNDFNDYPGLKHSVSKKKIFYKIIAEAVENVDKIEKANITSENFRGGLVIQSIIKNLKLNVFTFADNSTNAPKGYISDGNIYLNINNDASLNTETFLHEMTHLLFAGIKSSNPSVYQQLINDINNIINGEGSKDWANFKKDLRYSNLSKYDQIEEYLVKKLEKVFANEVSELELPKELNISALAATMFKLNDKVKEGDLNKKTIAALMATYGSDYNNLFNAVFPLSDHLNEIKLAEYKELLIEKNLLKENCN